MQSEKLIESLIIQTNQIIHQVQNLRDLELSHLTWRENPDSWNILECLEHLNLYGAFYLPEIEDKMTESTALSEAEFTSGFLGNYFVKSILPQENLKKIKTFKNKNPLNAKLDKETLEKFIKQQRQLLDLLHQSRTISLNKVRIKTTISPFIKIKLGDAFQFLINHIIRHLKQIEKVKTNAEKIP